MRVKEIGYWAATILLALELFIGAEWDLTRRPYAVQLVTHLGYPAYLLTILGCWKVLGGIAVLLPKFARLKEWAYAGVFFAMTGAAVSHAVTGDSLDHLAAPLSLAALGLGSWALRPQNRILGAILPAKPMA